MHFTLPLFCFNRPLHMFRFMQKLSSGGSKLHIFTSNGISVLIVMQYRSIQLPFTYKISLKSGFFLKTYYIDAPSIKSLRIR
jgi:hypothetical protein